MATLRQDGEDLCEVTFFEAEATGGGIKVIDTFGGPVYARERPGPTTCCFGATCLIPLGEVEITAANGTARVLVQSVSAANGVYCATGILLD